MHQKIAVLDFGGQYAHLIANRVRRLGVYSEILDNEISAEQLKDFKGVILSGGPMSVNGKDAPMCDPDIFKLGIPVLGICYGHQLMQKTLGGEVAQGKTKEYGMAELNIVNPVGIFKDIKANSRVWMSHFDMVSNPSEGFEVIGNTEDCPTAALADTVRNLYGIQFHAEVTHTPEGMKMLDNFLNICNVNRDWSIEKFIEEQIEEIKKKIGNNKVFLLVSGGVDSTVCFALLEKALGPNRVHGMLVDTGLMRLDEAEKVKKYLNEAGFTNLHVADKKDEFLNALDGVFDPEKKRKIIGDLFWKIKEDVAEELGLNPNEWIMGQGTIYPDTIETGGTKHADKIKTHHNRVDLVQQMIAAGKVIEPIAQLYKDEVRELGEKLGLPHEMVWRHPFPGPGLGVRMLCANEASVQDSPDFTELNGQIVDYLKQKFGLDDAEVRVLPIQSVGVQGDERTYRHPVALFTKLRDWKTLEKISTGITNRFSEVNRVMLCMSGEAGNFTINPYCITKKRVGLLQRADDYVDQIMKNAPDDYGIWQFPVVLIPTSTTPNKESIVLRPIVSTEAMTASFAEIDENVTNQIVERINTEEDITHIFYDLTHKPPGTIEWE
ncbi:glutamine-hydrolyzing GMP synthase [Candidatus Peregrinibacteria bacterium]|nr:glutamine-hydrolyzing GMP synthase [Candidatus Peregrinibacteria bacterium]